MKNLARLLGFWLNTLSLFAPRIAGRKGFDLFCTPVSPPVKDYHLKYFETSEQAGFDFEGMTIRSYRWGTGPRKVLLIHGWQSHSFRWKAYVDRLLSDGGYTVYAIDAPGHGQSGGKFINLPIYSRVIDHFVKQIQPVHAIISHSFGSFALLHSLFHDRSLPVSRIVIMGTPGEGNDFMKYCREFFGLSDRAFGAAIDYFVSHLGHPPSYYSAARFASGISIPGLIVHDRQDDETPYRYAQAIHAAWPSSSLLSTSGLGHNLKSPEVVERVAEFVMQSQGSGQNGNPRAKVESR